MRNTFYSRWLHSMMSNQTYKKTSGHILRAQERLKTFEAVKYTEDDIRGLSKAEKEFMRDNDMRSYLDYEGNRYYIFINRSRVTCRKQLYAYEKKQWMRPNGKDFGEGHNYEHWLTIDTKRYRISKFNYEYRHCEILSTMGII